MIALIAVSAAVYAIDKPYSYRIPASLTVQPGVRVMVPFGAGNRRCEGFVLALQEGDDDGLKAIDSVLDDSPVLSEAAIRLAAFMRERYFCTFYDAIKTMLPAGLWFDTSVYFQAADLSLDYSALIKRQPLARKVMEQIVSLGGRAELSQLRKLFPEEDKLHHALRYLIRKNYLSSSTDFSKRIQDKTEQIASLAVSAEETMKYAECKRISAPMQYELLKLLCAIGSGSTKELCYLTGAHMSAIRRLEALGYVTLSSRDVFRRPLPDYVKPTAPFTLNEEQQRAYDGLMEQAARQRPGVALLYGVTGSGKTAVYLQMIRQVLEQGRSAILLVPEIALTPQFIQLLMSQFGGEVAVLHSALRVSERHDEWKRIWSGKARVILGTRSAVFAPVQNLGLLIVDEEQEHTYKSENAPRYHAREIAVYRGAKEQALVVLGSATPSLESMYQAKSGVYQLYVLRGRYNGKRLPTVEIVDMKQELRQGNGTCLSLPLQQAISEAIAAGRQSILFLNRRGAGHHLICVECGEVPSCPRCSVSLTYHAANCRLMCHYCGFSQPVPDRCPRCGGHVKSVGTGTQRIEQELQALYPGTPVLRMDADTISAVNSHEAILDRFQKEKIPILVGTQMVTKGLNFENVTLVGVVDADMSLYMDHYRAAETTFSMITQVVGRAGRGSCTGRAIIQTMTPEHSVIQLAAAQNYSRFYDLEITLRQLHRCPPYGDLFTVSFSGIYADRTAASAASFRRQLEAALQNPAYQEFQIQVLGPAPAAIAKINNTYRYRIMVFCPNCKPMRRLMSYILQLFPKDKKNKGVTAYIDVNSYE